MTLRTITFDDEQWQVVPRELTGNMIDTINGHIDADSDAVALWRDTLIDAPEPPAQQPASEHADMLSELLAGYGDSGFSAERAALTAAIETLESQDTYAALLDCAEVLAEIVGCPQGVDEATIPAGGVDVRPEQVVVNISVSLVRLRRAQAALARLNGESDEG